MYKFFFPFSFFSVKYFCLIHLIVVFVSMFLFFFSFPSLQFLVFFSGLKKIIFHLLAHSLSFLSNNFYFLLYFIIIIIVVVVAAAAADVIEDIRLETHLLHYFTFTLLYSQSVFFYLDLILSYLYRSLPLSLCSYGHHTKNNEIKYRVKMI